MISDYERKRNVVNIEEMYKSGLSIARITESFTRESPLRAYSNNKHNRNVFENSIIVFENKGRRICKELGIEVPEDFLQYIQDCKIDPANSIYLDGKSDEMENQYDNMNVRLDRQTINTRKHFYDTAVAKTKNN